MKTPSRIKLAITLSPAELIHLEVALRIELERYDEDLDAYASKDKAGRKRAAKLHGIVDQLRIKNAI